MKVGNETIGSRQKKNRQKADSNHSFSISQFSNMSQPNNPLHGITLEAIVVYLVSFYGWEELGNRIRINCFRIDPSIKSSLKFLRRTPWARQKVEELYLETIR